MADDEKSSSDKTEEPTQRRIEEAYKRGQVPFSREVSNFLIFLALAFTVVWFAPYIMTRVVHGFAHYIESPEDIMIDPGGVHNVIRDMLSHILLLLAVPVLATVIAAVLSSLVQNGFRISGEPVMPKLEKISPLKGFKRIFSMRSVMEFIKGILKITIIGVVAYNVIAPELPRLGQLESYDMENLMVFLGVLAFRVVLGACIVMAVIAVLDWLYQRYEFLKSLRMTKQEMKEEFRQTEGDPHVKAKLKKIRQERARRRMMAAVPTADVVITNPTHYSVALKYEEDKMRAPFLVAKGKDLVALRIREIAKEHDIPLVENPPLARALYQDVELDEEIPLMFYKAVAEVISYVYQLKGKFKKAA